MAAAGRRGGAVALCARTHRKDDGVVEVHEHEHERRSRQSDAEHGQGGPKEGYGSCCRIAAFVSWMVSLEKLVEETDPKMVSNNSWLRHLVPHGSLPAVLMQNGGKGPAHQHGRLVLPATISDTECFARCRRPRKAAFNPGLHFGKGFRLCLELFTLFT